MTEAMTARRSWLVLPGHESTAAARYRESGADVAVLDLEYSVPPRAKDEARSNVKALAKSFGEGQAEVFVRIDRETRWADTAAAVERGVKGIVFPGPDEADEVRELAAIIGDKEKERGVAPGTTEIVLMLESAKGFWNAADIARAHPRVTALGVGRIDLTMGLGPVPQNEFRLYRFLMTRALVAARMHGKQPLGALWRPGSRGGVAPGEASAKAATDGRRLGFAGCFCATSEQVAAVNDGYNT
jgi:citrate lyase subunit beta/citryl-CoA lyase